MKENVPCFADPAFAQVVYQPSGQSDLPTWNLVGAFGTRTWPEYDWLRSREPELVFQRIRQLVNDFPAWQRRASTGRPPYDEQVLLAAILVRGYMRTTFADTESYMRMLAPYFGLAKTPDSSTISRRHRDRRFRRVLARFFEFILRPFGRKNRVIAVDSTGFSALRQSWRATPYSHRASRAWTKLHFAVDTQTGLVLSMTTTRSKLHDSRAFEDILDAIPPQFGIERTLADGAYAGGANLAAAQERGISPIHSIRKDAVWTRSPATSFQKLTRFARTFPNRFAALIGPRAFAETTVSMMKTRTDDRTRCRHPIAKENEIRVHAIIHNLRRTIRPAGTDSN